MSFFPSSIRGVIERFQDVIDFFFNLILPVSGIFGLIYCIFFYFFFYLLKGTDVAVEKISVNRKSFHTRGY